MIMRVPIANLLRLEAVNRLRLPEFGNLDSEEGFHALLDIDSYNRVHGGTAYPAVLLTTGLNDHNVPPWQAAKMAARLQATTISDNPVLLRVEFQGGHGASSKKQA